MEDLDRFRNLTHDTDTDPCIDSYAAAMPNFVNTPEALRNAAMHTFHDQQLEVCNSSSISNTFPGALSNDITEDILPTSEKLYYPIHKPRGDKGVVTAMRQAEHNLDDF